MARRCEKPRGIRQDDDKRFDDFILGAAEKGGGGREIKKEGAGWVYGRVAFRVRLRGCRVQNSDAK